MRLRVCVPFAASAAVIAAIVAPMFYAFASLRADDAYIVARYATQWWRGLGLVYNAGEPINMLTSPLHTWLAVGIGGFASDVVGVYQLLAASLVVSLLVFVAWSRWRGRPHTLVFLALTLASPVVALWTVGGLETPLLLVWCTAISFLCTKEGASRRDAAWLVLLSALAILTRYDAVLFVAPAAVAVLWRFRRDARVLAASAAGAMAILAWVAWTAHYYGDVLPTSFYVKATSTNAREIALGLVYVASFLLLSLAWVPVVLGRERTTTSLRTALMLGLALEFAYGVFAGTKHMMYAYRLFVPYLPALILVLMPPATRSIRRALIVGCLALQAALACFIYAWSQNPTIALAFGNDERFEFERLGARHTAAFLEAARAQAAPIAAHWQQHGTGERAPRIVVSTGGILPHALPHAYVLEVLASYRHSCRPDIVAMADYQQVVYAAQDRPRVDAGRIANGQRLIARDTIVADGLRAQPLVIAIDIWYEPNPAPLVLPPSIEQPCKSIVR